MTESLRSWVEQEDARKLHFEINQLSNQRLQITMVGLTIFFTANAALSGIVDHKTAPVISISFQIFFALLFFYSQIIRDISRCEAAYLIVTKSTQWEQPWRMFRRKRIIWHFSEAQNLIFSFLVVAQGLLPITLALFRDWEFNVYYIGGVALAIFLTMLFRIIRGRKRNARREEDIEDLWRRILQIPPDSSGDQVKSSQEI